MKLQPDKFDVQSINGYGPGWVTIEGEKTHASLVISAQGERFEWNCTRFEELSPEHFAKLAELDAEVVIFGSGKRNRFPPVAWLKPLIAKRVGLETMDTAAACRTYNILAGEGRRVVAALLLEAD
ncbi:Mth938-like domain-containing protein [Xylophilus sp. GOD-11R]|uniref:Mth938-like domain-containing protein n=1 Tax=Xylophilus sp. GOD-11R TaxID=3089814 RepID=UPI00298C1102|nr:Mth938-like domain-containing protein [Xylophilus sp. GOD-11R]WPB55108.1 Mth938-like domain-containing protein [Xylophilus sp. GOD-11R]